MKRWRRRYEQEGLLGLVDRRGGDKSAEECISPEAFEYFKSLYLDPKQPSKKACWMDVRFINKTEGRGWRIPSYPALVRHSKKMIPQAVVILYREGEAAWESRCAPYIEVDYSTIEPGQIWVGDHHQFNCLIRHRGQWCRPWVTCWEDMRSRAIVGRCVSLSPNQTTILRAMGQGVDAFGPPAKVHVDNGKDFDSESFTGTTKKRRRAARLTDDDEKMVAGIYAEMGVKVSFALPYHPQSKPIERFFDRLDCQFTKTMPMYCGKDATRKPADLAKTLSNEALAGAYDLDTFTRLFDQYVAVYNAAPHSGKGMAGRSPQEVMATRVGRRVMGEGVADLLLRTWSGVLKIGKNGVRFRNMYYGQYEPRILANFGREVRVSYNPDNVGRLYVHDAGTLDFIAIAEQNQLVAYGVVSDEALREAMKQKGHARKAMREQRDASLTSMLDLPQVALRAQADHDAERRRPAAAKVTPTLRAVKTKLDKQVAAVAAAERRGKPKRPEEKLVFDFDLLRRPKPKPIKLFDRGPYAELLGKREAEGA
jgi:transposase InsO family protein